MKRGMWLVTALGIIGFLVILNWDRIVANSKSLTASVSSDGGSSTDGTVDAVYSGEAVGQSECLLTPGGVRLKAVTTRHGIRALDAPDGAPTGPPMATFKHFYVFDVRADGESPQWYQIGTTPWRTSIVGWLPARQLVSWNSRYGVKIVNSIVAYPSEDACQELAETGTTSAEPLARATFEGNTNFTPYPVVESRVFKTNDGRTVEFVKIAFLAELKTGSDLAAPELADSTPKYTAHRQGELQQQVNTLAIKFALDNTLSTTDYVPGMIAGVKVITETVAMHRPELQLGLTLYRDYVANLYFVHPETRQESVTQHFFDGRLITDASRFISETQSIQAATIDSEDAGEAGYDALVRVILDTDWPPLGERAVVWISDNSCHPPDSPKNPNNITPEEIIQLAKENHVTVYGLCVEGGGGPDEQRLHYDQMQRISSATGGHTYRLNDKNVQTLAGRIATLYSTHKERVVDNEEVLRRLIEGEDKEEITNSLSGETLRQAYRFFELLDTSGVDLDMLGESEVGVAEGWVMVDDLDGTPLLEKHVYISRRELDFLLYELNVLYRFLSAENVDDLQRTAFLARVDPQSFFHPDNGSDYDFEVHLAQQNIPVSRTSGVLRLTKEEVMHMSEDRRAVLRERLIRQIIPRVQEARRSNIFTVKDREEVGWVPEHLLP